MKSAACRQLDFMQGLERRDFGVVRRMARDPAFIEHAARELRKLAATGRNFTSDDLREALGEWTPTHPNGYGAVILAAIRSGIIQRVGYRQSERKEARARVVAMYVGTSGMA